MMNLGEKVFIVTGAARGIGAAVAKDLAAHAACVVVSDLGVNVDGSGGDLGPSEEVAHDITAKGGLAVADGTNVADTAAVEGLGRTTQGERNARR